MLQDSGCVAVLGVAKVSPVSRNVIKASRHNFLSIVSLPTPTTTIANLQAALTSNTTTSPILNVRSSRTLVTIVFTIRDRRNSLIYERFQRNRRLLHHGRRIGITNNSKEQHVNIQDVRLGDRVIVLVTCLSYRLTTLMVRRRLSMFEASRGFKGALKGAGKFGRSHRNRLTADSFTGFFRAVGGKRMGPSFVMGGCIGCYASLLEVGQVRSQKVCSCFRRRGVVQGAWYQFHLYGAEGFSAVHVIHLGAVSGRRRPLISPTVSYHGRAGPPCVQRTSGRPRTGISRGHFATYAHRRPFPHFFAPLRNGKCGAGSSRGAGGRNEGKRAHSLRPLRPLPRNH